MSSGTGCLSCPTTAYGVPGVPPTPLDQSYGNKILRCLLQNDGRHSLEKLFGRVFAVEQTMNVCHHPSMDLLPRGDNPGLKSQTRPDLAYLGSIGGQTRLANNDQS